MSEYRNFQSISKVQDFCFQYFSNISSVTVVAIQLEKIVLNTDRIEYSMIDGKICVVGVTSEPENKNLNFNNDDIHDISCNNGMKDEQRTAYDLSRHLGLTTAVSDVMSSPQQMLFEIKNENEKKNKNEKNENEKYSNGLEVFNEDENELEDILSMAAAGAESYEKQIASLADEGVNVYIEYIHICISYTYINMILSICL